MSLNVGNLLAEIGLDDKQFKKDLQNVSRQADQLGRKFQNVGKKLTLGLTLPLGLAGAAAIKLASDFDESTNKVEVAFGSASGTIKDFSKDTLKQFGIAQGTALDMAATFGDMATSMGLNQDKAAKMSKEMVGLAGDLASFKNISIDIANTALTAVFTGETESLKRLGIVMTQANLQAFALTQGITKQIQEMTQAEQTNLRFAYVMANTTNAQGDFARTSGGAANQMRIFTEGLKQLGQQIGSVMLPLFTSIVKRANDIIGRFSEMTDAQRKLIVIVGGVVAAIGPLLFVIGTFMRAVGPLITAIRALNVAMLANPALLIAAGIAVLVAGLVVLYQRSSEVREAVDGVGDALMDVYDQIRPLVTQLATDLKPAFNEIVKVLKTGVIFYFTNMLTVIKLLIQGIGWLIDKVKDLGGWLKKTGESTGFFNTVAKITNTLFAPQIAGLKLVAKGYNALTSSTDEASESMGRGKSGLSGALAAVNQELKAIVPVVKDAAKTFNIPFGDMAKPIRKLPAAFAKMNSELQISEGVIKNVSVAGDRGAETLNHMAEGIRGFNQALVESKEGRNEFEAYIFKMRDDMLAVADIVANTVTNAFGAFFDTLMETGDVKEAFAEFGKSILNVLAQIVKKLIATVIAAAALTAILSAISGGSGAIAGVAKDLIGGFKKGGGSLFGGLFESIGGFAEGGRPPVGVPSWVGEKGAELFVPDRPGTIIPNHMLGATGKQDVQVSGRLVASGSDLVVVIENEMKRRGRL